MANSLLDFVMSLVRDSDAAARYAADPAQAIADAHLTDVTSADVNQLIPVVSESLSMGAPAGGLDGLGAETAGNVWASGAATAAFDAFDLHVPTDEPAGHVIEQPGQDLVSGLDELSDGGLTHPTFDDAPLNVSEPVIEDAPVDEPALEHDWAQPVIDDHHTDAGFDIFD
ncbi:Rv0340 family protein [Mycobacterium sp. 21AC1]|uniref:Rv0340 family IniB-related protein n=1 Tax=[Mycobacterium] appelbergii TaxID=2939269 RepID=UPI0029392A16|nr:Rv0340 family IniB-related protein [Mycobacterium sp. 21AC1]MDV3129548.1 Rv0340 family protein [Mycobacterium sp. 21AC1]